MIFSISWTPCVGAFLGSALMLAAMAGQSLRHPDVVGLLPGLSIPFIISALLINQLKSTFDLIKRHYRTVNLISGILLIIVGILMATGLMGRYLALLS